MPPVSCRCQLQVASSESKRKHSMSFSSCGLTGKREAAALQLRALHFHAEPFPFAAYFLPCSAHCHYFCMPYAWKTWCCRRVAAVVVVLRDCCSSLFALCLPLLLAAICLIVEIFAYWYSFYWHNVDTDKFPSGAVSL